MTRQAGTSFRSTILRLISVPAFLLTGTVASAGLGFLTQILLAHQLSVGDVGAIAALIAVVNFLTPLATGGVNYFLLQSFGREGWSARRWLSPCATFVTAATVFSCVVLAAYVSRDGGAIIAEPGLGIATAILILLGQVLVEMAMARFQLEGGYIGLSVWQGVTQFGRCAVLLVAVVSIVSLREVLIGYAFVGLATTIAGLLLLRSLWRGDVRLQGHPEPAPEHFAPPLPRPSLQQAARSSIPFALMTMFYVLYFQGPIVILQWLSGETAAGLYNAAFLIVSAVSLIPSVLYMKFLLPKICRWAEHDQGMYCSAFHVAVPLMTLLGLGLMAIIIATGGWLVPLLFSARYEAAYPALVILAVSIPVRFAQSVYSSLFVSGVNMVRKVRYLAITAVTCAVLSLCLVPPFGIAGAAAATLCAEICLLILHVLATSRFIQGINVVESLKIGTFRACVRHLQQRVDA